MSRLRFKRADGLDFGDSICLCLGDVAEYRKSRRVAQEVVYVSTEDLLKDIGGISKRKLTEAEGVEFFKGDILLGNIRPYLKKIWLADCQGVCSADVLVIRSKSIDPSCLFYMLSSEDFFRHMADGYKGSKMPRGDKKQIMEYKLNIPEEIKEQQKIAAFFIVIDRKLDILRKEKAFLEGARKGVVDGFFTRKMRLSESNDEWVQLTLGKVAEFYNGDRGKNYPSQKDYVNDGIPFINAGDLDGVSISNACVKITKEKYDSLGGAKIKQNDILYCLRGSLGKKAIVTINEGTIASSLIAIRANKVNYKFLFYFLDSCLEDKQRKLNDEGAAQPNLSAKSLKSFSIPVPSLDEQEKIAEFLTCFDSKVEIVKRRIKSVEKLKLAFMQKMFV